jgi:AraC-like DNA-binding protein
VGDRQTIQLLEGQSVGVFDVRCNTGTGGPGPEESADVNQIVLPFRGVFEVHREHNSLTVDAASIAVFEAGWVHRVAHPAPGGDRCLVLVFPSDVIEDALDFGPTYGGPVGPGVHLAARILASALSRRAIDQQDAEELSLTLLELIGTDLGRIAPYRPPGQHQRDRIECVRALLAAAPNHRWRLDELARSVHSTPFHLARQFRALTGTSIMAYLRRLRLALALQRLAQGESDLAGLAHDLGFAGHSHFSARFREAFGVTPASLRASLTAHRFAELSKVVTAQIRVAS